ncbi:MAG: sigma-70 family RNA polymerase sigma factor [Bacteroidota bacterium]
MFGKKSNDQSLITAISAGGLSGRKAENELFDTYNYLVRIGQNQHKISEDESLTAYSQTILAVIKSIQLARFRGESSLKTYVNQIFRRQCVNVIRGKTTNQVWNALADTDVFPEMAMDVFKDILQAEKISLLKKCMQQLSDTCRKLLWGAHYDGYSSEELAKMVGLKNAETVNVQKSRCRKKLMAVIESSPFMQENL